MLDGRIVAGRLVRQACERHLRDLSEGGKRGLAWHGAGADYAVRFFAGLRHHKGEFAGRPFVLARWQQFVVGSAFGWKRKADGLRRFRRVYQEVARKNGKTSQLGGIGLIGLVADGEPGAEVYSAATKRDQAKILFDAATMMVRKNPPLRRRIDIRKLNLSVVETASKFEPLSSDEKTLDGLNPHFVLIDELHKHRTRGVLDVTETAVGARRQPLIWIITTAGTDEPGTPYATERHYAEQVLDGVVEDDSLFAYIATLDKEDRWDDPAVWVKANPNLGVSVRLDQLQAEAIKARHDPAAQTAFKRLRLTLRTGATDAPIPALLWNKNRGQAFDVDAMAGERCFGGLDLSSKLDISAWVKLFPPAGDRRTWRVAARFWLPSENLDAKAGADRAPYRLWVETGFLELTPGDVIDHGAIEAAVIEDARRFDLAGVAYDPWNAAQLAVRLQDAGVRVHEFVQGLKSYTAPTKELMALLQAGAIEHGGNPVLAWMASNLRTQRDKNENVMPTKKSSSGRIDGMTALIMALGRSMVASADGSSFWDTGPVPAGVD